MDPSTNPSVVVVGWVNQSTGRGTLSIIYSCLLTMGLCIWSALHLNIPARDDSPLSLWIRNTKWILTGLFGPEFVVFAAWKQYNSARTLEKKISSLQKNPAIEWRYSRAKSSDTPHATDPSMDQSRKPSVSQREYTWSVVHGFYATMGGFVFENDTASNNNSLIPGYSKRYVTVTPRGVLLLAECGLLPPISQQEIDDKSKADSLSKALVCLQAMWMLLQSIARIASNLPVTLLEVNTLGHVVCALAIYVLWWHKPRSVRQPTVLQGEWVAPILAYMWMSSKISDPKNLSRRFAWTRSPISELRNPAWDRFRLRHSESNSQLSVTEQKPGFRTNTVNRVEPVCECEDVFQPMLHDQARVQSGAGPDSDNADLPLEAADNDVPEHWTLALEATQQYPAISRRMASDMSPHVVEELVTDVSGNWLAEGQLTSFQGLVMGMTLWFASIAFGAIHVAAWNEYFPTVIECWLWRSAGLYIIGSGFIWLMINFLGHAFRSFNTYWDGIMDGHASRPVYIFLGTSFAICGFLYAAARLFLVVESFISLRQMPVSAYDTPNWSQLIPHL